MGQEVTGYSMEARRARVLQALRVLTGEKEPLLNEDERAIINEYREICTFGYGRMEVVVVARRLEGINPTLHKKRKDLIVSPLTT